MTADDQRCEWCCEGNVTVLWIKRDGAMVCAQCGKPDTPRPGVYL